MDKELTDRLWTELQSIDVDQIEFPVEMQLTGPLRNRIADQLEGPLWGHLKEQAWAQIHRELKRRLDG